MLIAGSIILTLWGVLGMIPAFYFVYRIVFLDGNAPTLASYSGEEISSLSTDMLDTVNSIAVFANGTHAAFSLLVITSVWMGLWRRVNWVFWALFVSMTIAFIGGAASDYIAYTKVHEATIASGLFLLVGFICSALGLYRSK